MEKRDRLVRIFFHRKSETVLLFPYVCYMAGMGAAFGDAASLTGNDESGIGATVSQMLKNCRKAKVDPLAKCRTEASQRKWRGEDVRHEELLPGFGAETNWEDMRKPFPALNKGPAAYHRTFAVAEITERDSWKSRKVVQLTRSKYAGSESDGQVVRIPNAASVVELGATIVECLRSW